MSDQKAMSVEELRKKSKLPVSQAGVSTVKTFFDHNIGVIKAVLPQHVTPERMLKIALGAIRTTPKLQEATSESLMGAVITCAQLGLEPNTPSGHAYLIPFTNRRENRTDVQVIIGYRGLIDLARRSGQIVSISAHAVFANDKFSYEYGLDEHCKHIPADIDRGEITHFYSVAKLVGGGNAFEVMSRQAVEAIRDNSQNWKTAVRFNKTKSSIWTLHFEEMGRKTVIRRLYKYLPTSIEMARASALDATASTGEPQNLGVALEGDFTVLQEGNGGYGGDEAGGDDEPPITINTETGEEEVFDPELHLSPDRKNKNGTFTKRPHRGKGNSQKQQAGKEPDPLEQYIEGMRAATTVDVLNEARERANAPDAGLSKDQYAALDGFYQTFVKKITGAGSPPEQGDDFGGIE